MFKNKTRLGNSVHFKDQIKDLTSGVVHKFHCGFCNEFFYGECVGHENVRGSYQLNFIKTVNNLNPTFMKDVFTTKIDVTVHSNNVTEIYPNWAT